MKITAFQYGKTDLAESMIFKGGSPDVKQPIALLFFLIETGGQKILVDTGCDTMPGFELFEFESPVKVLERYISRGEITDVILTHSHHDHTHGAHYYKNARVFINAEAYTEAAGYLKENDNVITFEGELTVAPGVEVKTVGGHARGSCIVCALNTVLCGDECYSEKNLSENIMTGSSVCPENSRAFLEEYRQKHYRTVLFHAPDVVGEIGYRTLFEM